MSQQSTKTKQPAKRKTTGVRKFTPRQLLFAELYQKHHNATLAAIEAGYSPRSAYSHGSRLLKDDELRQRIDSYGQLGLDRLAVIATSGIDLAAERAAEALVDRAYGKAKDNDDKSKLPPITINFNRVDIPNVLSVSPNKHANTDQEIGAGAVPPAVST